jgi:hypothetical protein
MRLSAELDSLGEFVSPRLHGGEVLDVASRNDSILLGGYFVDNGKKVPLFILMDTSFNIHWDVNNAFAHDYIYTNVLFSTLLLNTGVQSDYGGGMDDLLIEQRDRNGNWNSGVTFGGQKNEVSGQMILTRNREIAIIGTSKSYDENQNGQVYVVRWPRPAISSSYTLQIDTLECNLISSVEDQQTSTEFYFSNGAIRAVVKDNEQHQLSIYDGQGKLIQEDEFRQVLEYPLTGFEPGLYIARLDRAKQIKIVSFR